TDAVLYPGFSGGALVDVSGRVVGLTNLMFGRGKSVAIGAPVVQQVAETLLAHGAIPRGYLGIRTQLVALPEGLRKKQKLSQEHALLVVQVENGSPAEQGGMMLGDTLLRLNGQEIQDVDQLRRHLRGLPRVELSDGRLLAGAVVGRDVHNDLAALRVPALGLPAAAIGDSTALRVGELIIAVGHPFGVRGAATLGIVSRAPSGPDRGD